MLAHVFDKANERFTAHIGGFDLQFGNFVGNGNKYFLSEVCEYKKNLNYFNADYAICLNIEPDHMDCYKDREELENTYFEYLKRAYKAIICADDKTLANYGENNAVTFGLCKNADFYADNVSQKNGKYSFDVYVYGVKSMRVNLKVPGGHNVLNALSVCACAVLCGLDVKSIKRGLENFGGVKRRFERIGSLGRAGVYADYAHHPTEISEAIKTAKEVFGGRIFVVFQPHTYSRTVFLKDRFVKTLSEVENLVIFKTFPAREEYSKDGDAEELAALIPDAEYISEVKEVAAYLKARIKNGDAALILGAGDLAEKLRKYLN